MKKRIIVKGRELLIGNMIITVCFLVLLAFAVLLSLSLVSTEKLRLENTVERAYSNVIVAMNQGESQLLNTMKEEGVLGFGYYSNQGNPRFVWGNAYQRLPMTTFPESFGSESYISSYNSETGVLESVRYVYPAEMDPDRFLLEGQGVLVFPDIIYLSLDGSDALRRLHLTFMGIGASIIALFVLYFIVMGIYKQNTEYREKLQKQENLVSLGQAARTLTHEIKNPLSAIKLQIALLKREIPENLRDDIALIDNETNRLVALTDRVSDFLRNPIGKPEVIDLRKTVGNLASLFRYDIRIIAEDREMLVYFDAERLRSVLENLIRNAIEASSGSPIECEVTEEKKEYHVKVLDRGCGFRKSDSKKIFDPFYTTKVNGSGIGLSIAQQFLEAAGGRITLYPRQGGGTVAEAVIPVYGGKR